MIVRRDSGLTLVELLISITITAIIASAAAALLFTTLQAQAYSTRKSQLYREGRQAMGRMTSGVRRSTYLLIPSAQSPTRDLLAFSGAINDDSDYLFSDPLFPRIDEDPHLDMIADWTPGIRGFDDDGDGSIDEGANGDDDEDTLEDEDPLDGLDNDGDGNIDEDSAADKHGTAVLMPGITGVDDDGDGTVDEGQTGDDDEDGDRDEDPLNPLIYTLDTTNQTLQEISPDAGTTTVLLTRVTAFTATYEPPDATHGPRVWISLTLTGDDGESVTFKEYAFPRNVLQRNGKRVR